MLILNREAYDKLEHGFFKPDYDEVLPALQAQVNHLASMSEKKVWNEVYNMLPPWHDDSVRRGWADSICALIVAQKEEAVKKAEGLFTGTRHFRKLKEE